MDGTIETRIDEYWSWITWALFLLLTVDLLTTVYAAHLIGAGAEVNPLVRWLLGRGGIALVAANVAAAILVAILFYGLMELLRVTPEEFQAPFALGIEVWLGLLLTLGLVVFANNLMVIVGGQSFL
jgi:hypothetical protein